MTEHTFQPPDYRTLNPLPCYLFNKKCIFKSLNSRFIEKSFYLCIRKGKQISLKETLKEYQNGNTRLPRAYKWR